MTSSPSRTPLATGPLENNKRHGAWTSVDDRGAVLREARYEGGLLHGAVVEYADGAVSVRGTYDRERRDGVWTTYYPSGAIKATETYVQGVRHGETVTYFESGQIETRGSFKHGARDGQHEKFYASGALAKDVTYAAYRAGGDWYERNAGRERELYEDGIVAMDRTYERGEIHGKSIANNDDSRDHERDMEYGVRHGLDKDWDGEVLTETRYVHGVPEEKAKQKSLAALATKLKNKKKDRYEKWDLVSELSDGQPGGGRLLWHLLREELTSGAELEDVWEDMADDVAATGDDVVTLLSSVKKFSETSHKFLLWPDNLDKLVCNVYARDPAPIDAALPKLPKHLRDAVRTVRARFGHNERDNFDADMAVYLAKEHATNGIGSVTSGVMGQSRDVRWQRDGELGAVSLSSVADADVANEAFYGLIELFTTREAYTEALLDVCLKSDEDLGTHRIADAIQAATPVQFGKMLAKGVVEKDLDFALTKLRKDPGETLLGWAKKTDSGSARTVLALVAADRFLAAGQPVPDGIDELLGVDCLLPSAEPWKTLSSTLRGRTNEWTEQMTDDLLASTTFADVDARMPAPFALYRKVLAALPRDRATAIVSRMFSEPSYRTECAIGLAANIATPELVSAIIEYAKANTANDVAFGLAALPSALALPAILEAHAKAKKASAGFWHLALLCTLAAMTERGETWPEEVDERLHFGPFGKTDEGMGEPYEHAMRKILHALPLARAQKIFDRGFAQKPAIALRTFLAIASHPVESVLRPAFDLLLADKLSLDEDHKRNIGWALSALREDGPRWARWILATRTKPNDDIRAALDATLPDKLWTAYDEGTNAAADDDELEAPSRDAGIVDKLKTLVEGLEGSHDMQTIYALVRTTEVDGFNQIGGVPRGVTGDRWPLYDDEPMQFVCMLDLETTPALRETAKLERARAFALFISNARHNEAYAPLNDHTQVIELTAAQLEHAGEPPDGAVPLALAGFRVDALDVPTAIFSEVESDDDEDEDGDDDSPAEQMKAIRQATYALGARAGGEPIWLQQPEGIGTFMLQLDETFIPELNLGDAGVMYVLTDTAFWQCH